MIIVSQDRKSIINFKNIKVIELMENIKNADGERNLCITAIYSEGDICKMGYYETEERAKEVLQEIVQKYSNYLKLEGAPAILKGQMDIQPNIFNIPKVYEMPEE